MKKYYVPFALLVLMGACGSGSEKKDEKALTPTVVASPSSNPDYQKGLELIAKSDCLTCHKVSEKLVGPAYKEVAAKYENTEENIALLTGRVTKGGSGVWGAIPMTPHAQLSEADARQMVKYILLLRK